MFSRLRGSYPTQFWLMFWGMLISTIGTSMVWPFLMIYVSERLDLPLTAAASLMTINSASALISTFIAGPVIDRFGRKWMMVLSLVAFGGIYLTYTRIDSYAFAALLMALTGMVNPLYRVGGDAMLADLIPQEQRPEAYALVRMSNNLGIAVGPAIGGFLAATSYNFAFTGAAIGMSSYALLLAVFARETLPAKAAHTAAATPPAEERLPLGGYLKIFNDRPFVFFVVAFTLNQIASALVWVLLAVYAKTNYGLSERLYGFIPMTNALMVVTLQALVTRQTRSRPPLRVMALGSLLYGAATFTIAFAGGFWGFWISMVILTLGELMLMPTATTYTASLAPAHMRGRYMSLFSLTWGVAQGIGPLTGGFLSDTLGPTTPWMFGGASGLLAAIAFVALARRAAASGLRSARAD